MEKNFIVSSMVMYEDESVDVHYTNGSRLQLSPCGSEFMLEKSAEPRSHPLQPTERVRQRTRFTVSAYKGLVAAALAFRNKYASRPYLPEEVISADLKKPFYSVDLSVEWSTCEPKLGSERETIIRSEDGRAVLKLSPSGQEFCVEFMCSLSKTQNQPQGDGYACQESHLVCNTTSDQIKPVHNAGLSRKTKLTRSRSCSPQNIRTPQEKPEQMYLSTSVVQHHSCSAAPSMWGLPLFLARHHWKANFSKSEDVKAEEISSPSQAEMLETLIVERRSHLPQALPLTCPSPHKHSWKVKDPLATKEHLDLPTELIKIMWCQGVIYRMLRGAVSVIEISPGDGSVIRSNDVLNSYFTHHKPESEKVKEVTYLVSSLPPDVPGQTYSISSIVSRASRILSCYNQAKLLLKFPATPSCLQDFKEEKQLSRPTQLEEQGFNVALVDQDMSGALTAECLSDLVAAELEKIKRFNFLMENTHLLNSKKGCADVKDKSADATDEPVNETCIAEALQRTSEVIKDIDALISAATLT